MPDLPSLRRVHPDKTLESGSRRFSLAFWRSQTTEAIVESLKPRHWDPDYQEYLKVKPDGPVVQGNTRIKVLEERGYNVNELARFPAS